MQTTLYFLRSSENKIVSDMLFHAHPHTIDTDIYSKLYGLTSTDLGLYALLDNKIAGAIWSRKLGDDQHDTLSLAVLPTLRHQGIGSTMMEQFLIESAATLKTLYVDTYNKQESIKFYEKFNFTHVKGDSVMIKILEKKEIIRPSDGYDSRRWMD